VITFKTLEMLSDDKVDTWYSIYASSIEKRYWNDTFRIPLTAGTYTFRDLSNWPHYYDWPPYNIPSTDSIVVPLSSDPSPSLHFGFSFSYWAWTGWEDEICGFDGTETISMTQEEWAKFNGSFHWAMGPWWCMDGSGHVYANVRGFAAPLP
jgi:hypothetical protein